MSAVHARHSSRRWGRGPARVLVGALCCLAAACDGGSLGGADAAGEVTDIDRIDPMCMSGPRAAGACGTPTVRQDDLGNATAAHIADMTAITYDQVPPSHGDHRSVWGKWGEYSYLPPQRWLHNLEHGGIAFLYDPCVATSVVEALRAFVHAVPADASGPFRWVLTPYPGLPSGVAVVAWGWVWSSECVDATAMTTFVSEHYRKAPEDVPNTGGYTTGWIGE